MKKLRLVLLTLFLFAAAASIPVKAASDDIYDDQQVFSQQEFYQISSLIDEFVDAHQVWLTVMTIYAEDYDWESVVYERFPGIDTTDSVMLVYGERDHDIRIFGYGAARSAVEALDLDTYLYSARIAHPEPGDLVSDVIVWLINSISIQSGSDITVIPKSDGTFVLDYANVLDESSEAALEAKISSLRSQLKFDIVVVSVNSTQGLTAQRFADNFYDVNKYGYGTARDGCLFLLTFHDEEGYRAYWTSTMGYGVTALTDYGISYISDQVRPHLSNGRYYEAFDTFVDTTGMLVKEAQTNKPYDVDHPYYTRSDAYMVIGAGGIIGVVIGGITLLLLKHRMRNDFQALQADDYIDPDHTRLTGHMDMFMYSQTVRHAIPRNTSSGSRGGGGGGGSSVHFSGGGFHGGGGGRF